MDIELCYTGLEPLLFTSSALQARMCERCVGSIVGIERCVGSIVGIERCVGNI